MQPEERHIYTQASGDLEIVLLEASPEPLRGVFRQLVPSSRAGSSLTQRGNRDRTTGATVTFRSYFKMEKLCLRLFQEIVGREEHSQITLQFTVCVCVCYF